MKHIKLYQIVRMSFLSDSRNNLASEDIFFFRYITTKVLWCFRIPKVEQPIIVEISINELEKSLIEKSNSTEESENESQANTPTNNTYDDEEFAKLRIENSQNYSN